MHTCSKIASHIICIYIHVSYTGLLISDKDNSPMVRLLWYY